MFRCKVICSLDAAQIYNVLLVSQTILNVFIPPDQSPLRQDSWPAANL